MEEAFMASFVSWWLILWAFSIAIHAVVAKRFKRGVWKWGILGALFGLFSLIWLIALGKREA